MNKLIRLTEEQENYLIEESNNIFYFRTPLSINIQLFIELFYICNFKCSYCYQKTNKFDKSEINYKKLFIFLKKKFIPEFLKIKNKKLNYNIEINILGGEPSLKSIYFYKEFLNQISQIFKNHFDNVKIVFLTNFSKSINYYKNLYKICQQNNLDLLIVATIHEEFMTLEEGFKKADELLKLIPKENFDLQIFKEKSEIIQKLKKLELLNILDNISFNSIDNQKYKNSFINLKSFIRPVKCYAYNYKIDKNLNIYHRCFNKKFTMIDFKFKPFYFCDKICKCASDEYIIRKELK